jgi:hypothetical protein
MKNTKIEWTDHTFNPWYGCQKVSDGCDNCYAERDVDKRFHLTNWGPHGTRRRASEAKWREPRSWARAVRGTRNHPRVFCASWADVFDNQAHSYASRVAGYLMAFGMPKAGDIDQRPSRRGDSWTENEIALCRAALLWTALREPVPGSGQKVEDLFVGKALVVVFSGDKARILHETARELSGQPVQRRAIHDDGRRARQRSQARPGCRHRHRRG